MQYKFIDWTIENLLEERDRLKRNYFDCLAYIDFYRSDCDFFAKKLVDIDAEIVARNLRPMDELQ